MRCFRKLTTHPSHRTATPFLLTNSSPQGKARSYFLPALLPHPVPSCPRLRKVCLDFEAREIDLSYTPEPETKKKRKKLGCVISSLQPSVPGGGCGETAAKCKTNTETKTKTGVRVEPWMCRRRRRRRCLRSLPVPSAGELVGIVV